MNQKLIMCMAVFLILVGGMGIFVFSGNEGGEVTVNKNVPTEKKSAVDLINVSFLIAKSELKAGQIVKSEDIIMTTLQLEPGQWIKDEEDAGKLHLSDYVVLSDISANSRVRLSQVAQPGSTAYLAKMVTPGYSVYAFKLDQQQAAQLSSIKAGEFLDVYMRYHILTSGYKTQVRLNTTPETRRIGDFNGTKILPLLSSKKMIYIDKVDSNGVMANINNTLKNENKNNANTNKVTVAAITNLYVELNDQDIKTMYSVEPFGDFVLFPASFEKNKSNSTNQILPEAIRQLKGRKG